MSKKDKSKFKKEENTANESVCNDANVENENTSQQEDNIANEAEQPSEEDELKKLQAEIDDYKDKYLRSVAEFDNYRKRMLKEKAELILNGGEKTIVAILPILDDMERAIVNNQKSEDIEAIKEGFDLIHQKFMKVLEGMGVKKIDTADAEFDTEYHNAIAMLPMGEDKKGKVIDCVKAGYTLNDKVIRHADVAVGE